MKPKNPFNFPEEPIFDTNLVGEQLFLTPYIMNGNFLQAKSLSKVINLNEDAAINIESYSGFITIQHGFLTDVDLNMFH